MTLYRIILDEAHRIRNLKNTQSKVTKQPQSQTGIACSGTIFNKNYTNVGAF